MPSSVSNRPPTAASNVLRRAQHPRLPHPLLERRHISLPWGRPPLPNIRRRLSIWAEAAEGPCALEGERELLESRLTLRVTVVVVVVVLLPPLLLGEVAPSR